MSSQIHPVPSALNAEAIQNHPRCKILESRNQYHSCHIQVPDSEERLAAIAHNDRFYSFFRLLNDRTRTLQIAAKLVYRGDEVVITQTKKGDVIWILEADARVIGSTPAESPPPVQSETSPMPSQQESESGLWRVIRSEREYQTCQIRVPDVAKPLAAICVDRQYYGFMRIVRDQSQAIDLAERLARKGNPAIITLNGRSCAVWVLEPDATVK